MMLEAASLAEIIAPLPMEERRAIVESIEPDPEKVPYVWPMWARKAQRPPRGDWSIWLYLAGRGAGKTRAGAEWIRSIAERSPKARIALVAPTAGDARDVLVEGESGLLAVCPPWAYPKYEPSKRRVTWPNGAMATLYSADEPERLRGPQHHIAWADELAAWRFLEDAWSNLQLGLRLGDEPQVVVTTTPKPIKLLKEILADATTAITRGSTYENRSNLAPAFYRKIITRYEGTRVGRQELLAEILDDIEGALFQRAVIDETRVKPENVPEFTKVVVGVDPAASSNEDSDETGIVVAAKGVDGEFYILDDKSCRMSPDGWGTRAVNSYVEHQANLVIGEVNNGGEMVGHVIRTVAADKEVRVAYKAVHATRGKRVRAEPISALYEQKKVHHVGSLPTLEDQLCSYVPDSGDDSPDRMDAMVWAMAELSEGASRKAKQA